jgi:transketolase
VDSHIGYGSPHKQDTYEAHGEPLGEAEVKLAKKNYEWPEDAKFLVPDGVYDNFKNGVGKRGADTRAAWVKLYADYAKQFPEQAKELDLMQKGALPDGWNKNLPTFPPDAKGMASRESSGKAVNALAKNIPWLIGGSADLAKSNKTNLDGGGEYLPGEYGGRNVHYGVREHAMGAAMSGMALCRLRPFGGTFFNFCDYVKPAVRLAALMELPVIYVFTHDSIGLGTDGPTHQPIEQLASLRAMPNILVLRPGDANEVVEAWKLAVGNTHGPTALVLSRQEIPTFDRAKFASASGVAKGAYVLSDAPSGKPDVILMATGSEVGLCVAAQEKLASEGIKARVVSIPSWELFERQDAAYKESVLPTSVTARVSVEMASTFGWERYLGPKGKAVGMHTFGASAPLKDVLKKFGFTVENVVAAAKKTLAK